MGTTTGTIPCKIASSTKHKVNRTMQLFGLPYQFMPQVDQRDSGLCPKIGHAYLENIVADASVVTIIPGEPKYLPGKDAADKVGYTNALLDAAGGSFTGLKQKLVDDAGTDVRLYEFQPAYYKTFGYINILCRTCAAFLNIGSTDYKINGEKVNFLNFDWKNYRWEGTKHTGTVQELAKSTASAMNSTIKSIGAKLREALILRVSNRDTIEYATDSKKHVSIVAKAGELDVYDRMANVEQYEEDNNVDTSWTAKINDMIKNRSFIQFYIAADSGNGSDSMSNSAQDSQFSSLLDQGAGAMRDLAFLNQSGGIVGNDGVGGALQKLGESALNALSTVGNGVSASGSFGDRLKEAAGTVMAGENFAMPKIWGGSENSKSYSLSFKFKAPYGNTLCFYTDVLVPVCHWIALAYPRSTGPNSFKSPPLVKMYRQGVCVCNLGLVTSVEINRDEVPEAMNTDGQITEVTVNVTIEDLYSDIATDSPNDPIQFYKNTSLTEYLGTMCGLDLTQANMTAKGRALTNNLKKWAPTKISSVGGNLLEFLNEKISAWARL